MFGNPMQTISIILAVILTVEQAFDCISTNLVISKGRGHEGNGLVAWLQGKLGQWWWIIKLPVVAVVWWIAVNGQGSKPVIALLIVMVLVYAYVLWNNYKIAWRHN